MTAEYTQLRIDQPDTPEPSSSTPISFPVDNRTLEDARSAMLLTEQGSLESARVTIQALFDGKNALFLTDGKPDSQDKEKQPQSHDDRKSNLAPKDPDTNQLRKGVVDILKGHAVGQGPPLDPEKWQKIQNTLDKVKELGPQKLDQFVQELNSDLKEHNIHISLRNSGRFVIGPAKAPVSSGNLKK